MIRAATPLTILLFAAFGLLLVSVLSVPVIKQITLATYNDVSYGVFGFCVKDKCSGISIGYNPDTALGPNFKNDFTLPSNARNSLSSLLIIHPIAAALTLILMVLAACSHLHGPSHNPKYLLATLLFSLPTFLASLLAFLVDILLFIPHLTWGGWLVLAATICILAAGIMTCAMRRTVVSRAAQKARIAVNAEMNGSAYREAQAATIAASYGNTAAPSTGTTAVGSTVGIPPTREPKLPEFATFDVGRKTSTDGDRVPLNPRQTSPGPIDGPNGPGGFDPSLPRHPTPNEFNNGGLNRQRSNHTIGSDGFASAHSGFDRNGTPPVPPIGAMGPGGRGGYPPRGGMRGRGGPGMGPGPRGGFGGPRGGMGMGPGPRGGMTGPGGPRGGGPFRGRGGPNGFYVGGPNGSMNSMEERPYIGPGPPPVWGGAGAGFDRQGTPGFEERRGTPGFDNRQGTPGFEPRRGTPGFEGGNMYGPPPRRPTDEMNFEQGGQFGPPPRRPTNEIPPKDLGYGQPENTRYASPPPLPPAQLQQTNKYPTYEMDTQAPILPPDVVGLAVGSDNHMGQGRTPSPAVMSPTSRYSNEEYVPPRQAWAAAGKEIPSHHNAVELPVELPASASPVIAQGTTTSPTKARRPSADYYEDVEPRFDPPETARTNPTALPLALQSGYAPPSMATAEIPPERGMLGGQPPQQQRGIPEERVQNNVIYQEPNSSYEELQPGQRSPAMSTSSHFTSVSQRGVNPRWPGDTHGGALRRPHRQNDMILNSNPDFELPSRGAQGGRRGGFGY